MRLGERYTIMTYWCVDLFSFLFFLNPCSYIWSFDPFRLMKYGLHIHVVLDSQKFCLYLICLVFCYLWVLNLWADDFYLFKKIHCHFLFRYCFCSILLPISFWYSCWTHIKPSVCVPYVPYTLFVVSSCFLSVLQFECFIHPTLNSIIMSFTMFKLMLKFTEYFIEYSFL